MGCSRHKWSIYFKILDELANKSNKAAICLACLGALGSEAKKITNKSNLCYNHLKSCPYFAQKYSSEELEKIFQIDNESNSESSEDSIKKIKQTASQNDNKLQQFEQHIICRTVASGLPFKWIQDKDIVAAFKLVNPTIKLPLHRKLSGSILKKE
ncbi:31966_t:CDS:2, partial [Racocetra persica]